MKEPIFQNITIIDLLAILSTLLVAIYEITSIIFSSARQRRCYLKKRLVLKSVVPKHD